MICPYCNQGRIIKTKIKRNNKEIHICEECDTVWRGEINLVEGQGFDDFMRDEGCEADWSELII